MHLAGFISHHARQVPLRAFFAALALAFTLVLITAALHAPLLHDIRGLRVLGAFHDGHVWAFDRIAHIVTLQEPLALTTSLAAFPGSLDIRYLAWVPALLALPFRPLLGPLGAYNAVVILSPALAGLAAWLLFQRVSIAGPWTAAGASLSYALCPFALGNMANGQTEKLSHWLLPLSLWALCRFVESAPRWSSILLLVLTIWAAAFTEPTLTLILPVASLALGVWILGSADASERRQKLLRLLLAALIAALALLPAWLYYHGAPVPGASVLQPGPEFSGDLLPDPPPVALLGETFLGSARRETNPALCNHVTYLGLPLILVAGILSLRRFPGRGLGLAWGVLGTVLAFGPRLAHNGRWFQIEGGSLWLPAHLLDLAQYPLEQSGMYYRFILLGSLGLGGLLAGGLSGSRRAWIGALLAWILGLGAVADGVRATAPLWPRPVAAIPGAESLREMAQDPLPGAVLDLPMETDTHGNGLHLLSAVLHGRPTTALAAHTRIAETPNLHAIEADLQASIVAGDTDATRALLYRRGYRYVVWRPGLSSFGRDLAGWSRLLGLPRGSAVLSPQGGQGGMLWWPLEPEKGEVSAPVPPGE